MYTFTDISSFVAVGVGFEAAAGAVGVRVCWLRLSCNVFCMTCAGEAVPASPAEGRFVFQSSSLTASSIELQCLTLCPLRRQQAWPCRQQLGCLGSCDLGCPSPSLQRFIPACSIFPPWLVDKSPFKISKKLLCCDLQKAACNAQRSPPQQLQR